MTSRNMNMLYTVETATIGSILAILAVDDPTYTPAFRLETATTVDLLTGESSMSKYAELSAVRNAHGIPAMSFHVSQRNPAYVGKTLLLRDTGSATVYRGDISVRGVAGAVTPPYILTTSDPHVYIVFTWVV